MVSGHRLVTALVEHGSPLARLERTISVFLYLFLTVETQWRGLLLARAAEPAGKQSYSKSGHNWSISHLGLLFEVHRPSAEDTGVKVRARKGPLQLLRQEEQEGCVSGWAGCGILGCALLSPGS